MARAVPEPADGAEINRPPSAAWRGTVPVAFLIAAIFAGLYLDSSGGVLPRSVEEVARAFGAADAARVLLCASALAVVLACALHPHPEGAPPALAQGMTAFAAPASILIGAWALGSVLKELQAADWIGVLCRAASPWLSSQPWSSYWPRWPRSAPAHPGEAWAWSCPWPCQAH